MIYLQLIRLLVLSGAGVALGLWLSRKKKTWVLGYLVPLSLALVFAACCWFPTLGAYQPFDLLLAWPRRLVIMLFGTSLLFATLIPKMPKKASRNYVVLFASVCVCYFGIALLLPTALRGRHLNMHNSADKTGICRQSTPYTCGPASTVIALAHHGVYAEEGEMAIRTHCNPLFGTQAEDIVRAVNRFHGNQGVVASRRNFGSPAELPKDVPVVIAIEYSFMVDHFIVVKRLVDGRFEILDPIAGKSTKTESELSDVWRRYGVVISQQVGGA